MRSVLCILVMVVLGNHDFKQKHKGLLVKKLRMKWRPICWSLVLLQCDPHTLTCLILPFKSRDGSFKGLDRPEIKSNLQSKWNVEGRNNVIIGVCYFVIFPQFGHETFEPSWLQKILRPFPIHQLPFPNHSPIQKVSHFGQEGCRRTAWSGCIPEWLDASIGVSS